MVKTENSWQESKKMSPIRRALKVLRNFGLNCEVMTTKLINIMFTSISLLFIEKIPRIAAVLEAKRMGCIRTELAVHFGDRVKGRRNNGQIW